MPSDSSDWYAANNFMDLRICWCVCCAYGNWWVWFMPLIILCLWQMVPEYLRPRSKPKTYLPLVNIIFLISCANFLIFRRTPNLPVASLFHSLVSSHFFRFVFLAYLASYVGYLWKRCEDMLEIAVGTIHANIIIVTHACDWGAHK